jgi:hypothetical protein
MEPIPGTGEDMYVSGSSTEKYRTYGAPEEWNSLYISQALRKVVQGEGLETLDWPHIEILDAATQVEIVEKDHDDWQKILNEMKLQIVTALCYREYSTSTIRILKKFFFSQFLQKKAIEECTEIFIKILSQIYQPDTEQECKDNLRDFLELLHEGREEDDVETPPSQDLKNFVYKVIKAFAEENQKSYQASNLI